MDANERWRALRLHVEDQIPLAVLARETGISARTLQRWKHLYRVGGVAALDPHDRTDKGVRRTPGETVAFIERLALTRPRPGIATLHRLASTDARAHALPSPSYATVRQIVQALDPALVTLALEGPVSYRDKHELVFRRRAEHPNQTWQSDHTELDILIVGAGGKPDRPWLTTVMDDYSRAICGYMVFSGAPSAINTALALRQAIWRKTDPAWAMCGIPDILHVDHGSDFISHHIERTAIALHIRIIHSTVGRPQGRGKIERFFRTINTEFLAALPDHLGSGSRTPTPVLDLAGLDRAIGAFIGTYNDRIHSELGISPRDAWVADGWLPRMPDSLTELDGLLLTVPKNRVVQRDGIHFQGQRYLAPTLAPFVGHMITIRYDPRDISEIRVYDRDTFICTAIDEAHPNLRLSLRDIETARRARRKQLRRAINDRIPTVASREEPRTHEAAAEAAHLRRGRVMNQAFIVTKEHRRFSEFANAVRKEKTIGICHGAAGIGKTNSARRYANWDELEPYINEWGPRGDHDAKYYALANRSRTVFYTPEVLCRPKDLMHDIDHWQMKVGICVDEHLRSLMPEPERVRQNDVTRLVELLIVDEAERLTPTALELLRDQHDRTHRAIILIDMPGINERFRHYPQLYSRLGFSHQYRALGREELLFVLDRHWKRLGKTLDPDDFTDAQAIAAIERITRGNFRLLERLFPQINRVLKINELDTITDDVIEAAASILVIGN